MQQETGLRWFGANKTNQDNIVGHILKMINRDVVAVDFACLKGQSRIEMCLDSLGKLASLRHSLSYPHSPIMPSQVPLHWHHLSCSKYGLVNGF